MENTEQVNYGARADGTEKGSGYLGPLQMTDGSGKVATEISVGIEMDGKEVEIPTLVPTLSDEEKTHLQSGKEPTKEIVDKATAFAISRMDKGKSPFIEKGELPEPEIKWETEYVPEPEVQGTEYVDAPPIELSGSVVKKHVNGINKALQYADANEQLIKGFVQGSLVEGNMIEQEATQNRDSAIKGLLYSASTYGDQAPEIANKVTKDIVHMNTTEAFKDYVAYIRSMNISKKMTEGEIEHAASQAYRQDLSAALYDDISTMGTVKDFAQMVLLPTDNWKMHKLAQYVGIETSAWDLASKGSFVNKFIDSYQKLPAKSQAIIAGDLVQNWETIGGFNNKLELMAFLAKLDGMDTADKAMTYFEGLTDTVAIIGVPLKVAQIAARGTRLASSAAAAKRVSKITAEMTKRSEVVEAAVQTSGVLHRTAALETPDTMADIATAGLRGQLTDMGVDTTTAANTMTPFDTVRRLTPGAPEGQATLILKRQQLLDDIVEHSSSLGLPMSEGERTALVDKILSRIEDADEVTSASVLERTKDGIKIGIKTVDGGEVETVRTFKYTDVGTWEDLTYIHAGVLGSPKFKLPGIARDLVDTIQFGLNKGAKMKGAFDRIIRSSRKPLTSKQSDRVDALLAFGEGKKEYSYYEAVQAGVNGLKLTEDEYQAYAATRQVFNSLHAMKEKEIAADFAMKNIQAFDLNGSRHFGKVYEDIGAAKNGAGNVDGIDWHIKDGHLIKKPLTSEELEEAYTKGYKLVRANGDNIYYAGQEAADWALVKATDLSKPTGPILNVIPGYVTRISKEGNFFFKKKEVIKVGGKERVKWTTIGYDNVYSDLEKFRLTKQDPDEYKVFADRELSRDAYDGDVVQSFGGLYTGSRASTPPVYGLGKKNAKMAPVLESLQRYIQNVAKNQPISIYREGLKQKWINTAVKNGMITEADAATKSFAELGTMVNRHHDKYFFFDRSHKEIDFISSIRTFEEQEWTARLHALGKWAEKRAWSKPMASFFYNGALQKVDNAFMAATYHTLLGYGNMAQIPLQFSAALIPVAVNPLAGVKGLFHALGLTVQDYLAEFGKISHVKTNKVDMGLWNLWNESGMRESTKYATFDYYSMFNDTPYKANVFQWLMSKSDAPVRIGQQGANRVAFATAYHYVADKLKRVPTMDDLPAIAARADEYLLNMGRANMAGFQRRDALKYAGMFMQVQTKFIEKIFGREFTGMEKGRLLIAQAAMFGAQGVPLVGSIGARLLSACGFDGTNTDSDTLAKYQRGMFGWYMTDYLGTNAEFSARFALGGDFAEKALGMIYGETDLIDMVGGAPVSVLMKSIDALEKAIFTTKVAVGYENATPELALSAAKVIAQELLSVPLSVRNLIKGYTMYNSKLYHDKGGVPVFMYQDPSLLPALTQAFGFQNIEAAEWYKLEGGSLMSKPDAKKSLAKAMAGLMTKLINADADRATVYAMAYNALNTMALSIPGGQNVNDEVIKHLQKPDKGWEDQILKGLAKWDTEYTENMDDMFKVLNIKSSITARKALEESGVK